MRDDSSMKKVPFAFQNAVRKVYFDLLRRFVEDQRLILNLENYKEDVILSSGFLREPAVVAIIDSHSPWGEPDDLTNEFTPRGLNTRTYNGLKIIIKNFRYRERIEKIAENMRRNLEEDVIVKEMLGDEDVKKKTTNYVGIRQ